MRSAREPCHGRADGLVVFFKQQGTRSMYSPVVRSIGRVALLLIGAGASLAWAGPTRTFWHDAATHRPASTAPQPEQFRGLTLQLDQVSQYLKAAHASGQAAAIELPVPEGGFAQFMVVDSGTMPAQLQAKYPDILSFKGRDAQGRALRLDVSPLGLQAMVFDPAGLWVIRPEAFDGGAPYLSFRRAMLERPDGSGQCEVHGQPGATALDLPDTPMTQTGVTRRVYRAAVAANHQYIAAVGGGTVEGGLAATIVTVNRVSQVYETEMSIQLVLVPDNDLLMYPGASGDPFGSNGTGVISNSTSVISAAIGVANYDIGHVLTTGSGGVAWLGVVCNAGLKGRGTTGLPNPVGDAFYIDYVAHEMGHQFGGNHPFNGTISNCSGGDRNGATAYEPGSGSSIMAYAGICGADNLQTHSDPHFHAISLQEITNFTNGAGNCSANTSNPNQAPVIETANLPTGYTIPARTPFVLAGAAVDADEDDTVSYSWEEWDLGPAAPLSAGDNGSSPIFRAFAPRYSGSRVFPSLSTILTGVAVKGETLPTTTRTLKFRLTARDQHPGQGTSTSADLSVAVTSAAGPFKVNAPNTAVTWPQGSSQTVGWDVAGSTAAPVNCASVDITLSADGGYTFPYVLAAGVPNNGSASVVVPALSTSRARIAVACADNIFFDISDADFQIPPATGSYSIGGVVSGLVGSGLVIALNGTPRNVAANGAYTFADALPSGSAYAVTIQQQPALPAQTCTVSNPGGTVGTANVTNVGISCTTAAIPTYTVGGTISQLYGSGLSLQLNGNTPVVFGSSGPYTFLALPDGSPYRVRIVSQPQSPAQTCTVSNAAGTVDGAAVDNVDVSCTGGSPTHTIGGSVSGLGGAGLVLSLNGGVEILPVAADGPFTFTTALAAGTAYQVLVQTQPEGQTCSVADGSGIVPDADVTNVEVSCAALPPAHSVGGSLVGVDSGGLLLALNDGAQTLTVAAGATSFVFATPLAEGSPYAVTVQTQPAGLYCIPRDNVGVVGSADVTSVIVDCTDRIFANDFEGVGIGPG